MKLAYRILRLISRRQARVLPKLVTNFDEAYYLYWYHDVHGFPGGPLEHFLGYGWMEGRDPNAWFDTRGYLFRNEDRRLRGATR